jgi:hypothetical protein
MIATFLTQARRFGSSLGLNLLSEISKLIYILSILYLKIALILIIFVIIIILQWHQSYKQEFYNNKKYPI